jgi:hypothetical protein
VRVCRRRQPDTHDLAPRDLVDEAEADRSTAPHYFNGAGKVVAAYAAAERRGAVQRASNVRDIDPEEYARRLYADGVAKGWLR